MKTVIWSKQFFSFRNQFFSFLGDRRTVQSIILVDKLIKAQKVSENQYFFPLFQFFLFY